MKKISLLCCFALFSIVLVGCGGGPEGGVIDAVAQPPGDIELEMETEEYAEGMDQLGQEQ